MGLPGIYFIDTNGKKENEMPQKIIKEDSPFEFLGQHLEVTSRRGELLGLKKAILELTKLETKIEETLREMEGKLDESYSQDK